jgi:LmbE family N-acetylglucosaminyl deacetylase
MEHWFIPYQTSELPQAQKVLILAPHPDDEVFGCGGAAALLGQRGAAIDVFVLTDGAGFAVGEHRHAITQTRQAETNAALAVLGLRPAQFWGAADRSLVNDATTCAQKIEALLKGVDLVFAPSLTEVHPDHATTGQALVVALNSLVDRTESLPSVLFYEVGAPLSPNFLLDITSVWCTKKQAMACFESQQITQDYARHIEGLNTFRTYSLDPSVKYAEAYHLVPAERLQEHLNQYAIPTRASVRDVRAADEILRAAEATAANLHRQLIAAEQKGQTSEMAHTIERLEGELNALHATIGAMERTQKSLLNSRSWRLTRPLRWLGRLLSHSRT